MNKSEILRTNLTSQTQIVIPLICMKSLVCVKKMADKLQNHGLGIHSDKICGDTKNTAQSFSGDLPNWPKCLGVRSP